MPEEWFRTWFDTDYYHLLYEHRDENEARQFVDALLHFLNPSKNSRFLDVACGKGRHSVQLSEAGFDTTGIDLSQNSIQEAMKSAGPRLRFHVNDIREPIPNGPYDFALNLFTSFGYFETQEEHVKSLKNIRNSMAQGGKLIIDFMNVRHKQMESGFKEFDKSGVVFRIGKRVENGYVIKSIQVQDGLRKFEFEERVMAFSKEELESIVDQAGFKVQTIFGCYDLTPFNADSERVIIIAERE
ncbi:MAG: methyltransferase domain-containing protein [Flavobacteriales bacterium]